MKPLTRSLRLGREKQSQVLLGLILLAAINLLNQLDRRALTAVFPLLQAEWGLSDAALGLVVALSTVIRTLFSLPAGWLADRRGALHVLRMAALLWSVSVGASGLAANFGLFALLRGGVGLADGANGPADLAYLGALFPKRRRATSISVYSAALYAGSAFGLFLGGFIGEHFGWRWVFLIVGGIGLLVAIGLQFGPQLLTPAGQPPHQAASPARLLADVDSARRTARRYLVMIFIGGTLGVLATTALVSWAPTYLVRRFDLSLTGAGLLVGGLLLPASIAGTFAGGLLSDRLLRAWPAGRAGVAAGGLVAGVLPGVIAFWADSLPVTLMGFFVAGVCLTLPVSPLLTGLQESVPIAHRGKALAVFGTFTQLFGAAPATFLVGWLSDHVGLQQALLLPFLAALLGGLCLWFGQRQYAHSASTSAPA